MQEYQFELLLEVLHRIAVALENEKLEPKGEKDAGNDSEEVA